MSYKDYLTISLSPSYKNKQSFNLSTRPQSVALRALALETVERVSAILTPKGRLFIKSHFP